MITRTETTQETGNAVVSLMLAKSHLRVDGTEEDALITLYASSAQAMVEKKTGRAVGLQTFVLFLDSFDSVVFDKSLNDEIEKVEYFPAGSDELTLLGDTSLYSIVDGKPDQWLLSFDGELPAVSDRDDAVKVTVKRGFAPDACPAPIKAAMLLMIGDSFERREDRAEVGNTSVDNLLRQYRRW